MDRRTEHIVRLRAGGVCEYCRIPEAVAPAPFPIDHIIALKHRGRTVESNLALACAPCNYHKGPNIGSLDPASRSITRVVRLFNPRIDRWPKHFRWHGARLVGITAIGRATVRVLAINDPVRMDLRRSLMNEGLFPRDPLDS